MRRRVGDPLLRGGVGRGERDLAHRRIVFQVHATPAAAHRSRVQ
ncbi:hypothetical protein [Amycolatopsis sp. EV170708-02-1]|nr:hypothetical protein [Amycolatopsis sp. EV170708-02-1]